MTFYGTTASAAGIVVPKNYLAQVGEDGFRKQPVGAGPYKFVRHKPGLEVELEAFLAGRRPAARALAELNKFNAKAGQVLVLTGPGGQVERVLMGLGSRTTVDPGLFRSLAAKLPAGDYRLARLPRGLDAFEATLAFAMGLYRFDRYRQRGHEAGPQLVAPKGVDPTEPITGPITHVLLTTLAEICGQEERT